MLTLPAALTVAIVVLGLAGVFVAAWRSMSRWPFETSLALAVVTSALTVYALIEAAAWYQVAMPAVSAVCMWVLTARMLILGVRAQVQRTIYEARMEGVAAGKVAAQRDASVRRTPRGGASLPVTVAEHKRVDITRRRRRGSH